MKNLNKLLIAIAVIAVVLSAVAMTSTAVNFNGELSVLKDKLEAVNEAPELADKLDLMNNNVRVYLFNRPVDPLTKGFDEAMELFDSLNAALIEAHIAQYKALGVDDTEGKKALFESLFEYINKMKATTFYYDPVSAGDGAEPVANKYGQTLFYNNNSTVAEDAREALSDAILEFVSTLLLPGTDAVVDQNETVASEYIDTYLSMKAADPDAQATFKDKLVADAAALISHNAALREQSLALHVFLRDCAIEYDVLRPSKKNEYKNLMQLVGELEYVEFKSNVAAYFAYEYQADDTLRHNRLNSAADRISVNTTKYKATMLAGDDYESIMSLANEVKANIAQRNEQKKQEIEYSTSLNEYDLLSGQINLNMDDGRFPYQMYHGNDSATGSGNGGAINIVDDENVSGNKYLEFTLGRAAGEDGIPAVQPASVSYVDMRLGDTTNGYVMEFDVMTKSDTFKSFRLHGAENGEQGTRLFLSYIWIIDGVLNTGSGQKAFEGAFTPGEWTHISFCYKPDDGQGNPVVTVYVDYEWIGYWWSVAQTEKYKMTILRITPSSNHYNVNIDNIHFYQGTTPRNLDKFANKSDVELFKMYTDICSNPDYGARIRDAALNEADLLLDSVKDEPTLQSEKKLVEVYNADDKTFVMKELNYLEILDEYVKNRQEHILNKGLVEETMKELKNSVGDLFTTTVTTENISKMTSQANKISSFIQENSGYIVAEDPEVVKIKQELSRVKRDIVRINNLVELLSCLEKFDRATSCASMTKRMQEANKWYTACELYDASVYELIKNDPAVVKYEEALDYPDSGTKLLAHVANMQSTIDAQRLLENSRKIINCVDLITSLEGYEPTSEFYFGNMDVIDPYIAAIRAVLKNGNYDRSFDGLSEAIEKFEKIYPYYYERSQQAHAAAIKEKLDIYAIDDTFITRLGVCAFVKNYIETNDIDLSNKSIAPLIELYGVYTEEIESQEDIYNATIEQNTYIFINLIKRMQTTNSYKEIKSLHGEASVILCAMNVSSDEAKAAIALYDAFTVALQEKEETCAAFVEAATRLKYCKNKKDTYAGLVECSKYLEDVDTEVRGVESALKSYNEKLAEYNAAASTANGVIEETGSLVMSVRTVSIHSAILEIIKNLFSK